MYRQVDIPTFFLGLFYSVLYCMRVFSALFHS